MLPSNLNASITDLDKVIASNQKILDTLPEGKGELVRMFANSAIEPIICALRSKKPEDYLAPFVATVIITQLCAAMDEWKLNRDN